MWLQWPKSLGNLNIEDQGWGYDESNQWEIKKIKTKDVRWQSKSIGKLKRY